MRILALLVVVAACACSGICPGDPYTHELLLRDGGVLPDGGLDCSVLCRETLAFDPRSCSWDGGGLVTCSGAIVCP
jgi:hypothetical protein